MLKNHAKVVDPTAALSEWITASVANPYSRFEPGVQHLPPELASQFSELDPLSDSEQQLNDKYFQKLLTMIGALYKAGVPIVADTDQAVPGYSLYRELELYVDAGLTPTQAIQSATSIPAKVMGVK